MGEKKIMLGNEAIARGAWEAGVKVSAAYPGTPSTEISENIVKYEEIYAEWAPNEKVATEVAIGASISGVRAMASMKHVGLNVAADPLYTAAYTGVTGGLVLVVADDPGMYSSQMSRIPERWQGLRRFRYWSRQILRRLRILLRQPMTSAKNMIPLYL